MIFRKKCRQETENLDSKERILHAAMHLFAVKGFAGTTIRDIAEAASVNVASVNYYYTSKDNLRREVFTQIVNDFRKKISSIKKAPSLAMYAVSLYEVLIEDADHCLNQFKLVLEADEFPFETEAYPLGYEEFSVYLDNEVSRKVSQDEKLWAINVLFSYIIHIAVMSSTYLGKKKIEKFFPKKKASIPVYIENLVCALVRDLNARNS